MERPSDSDGQCNCSSVGYGRDVEMERIVNRRCCASTLRGKKEQTALTDLDLRG